jgi:hypothetical protein
VVFLAYKQLGKVNKGKNKELPIYGNFR